MDYATAVESAPPGWRHFAWADIRRLPSGVLQHEMARVPTEDMKLAAQGDAEARKRVLRSLFWTLVYHLEAARWDELARCEPIHPALLDALPDQGGFTLDVGAGSGRLTQHLVERSDHVLAIEPSLTLGSILTQRLPSVAVVSAWAEHLPLPSRCAKLTAACGVFGPDPGVLAELQRVTSTGGCIALVNPESPEWFEGQGWSRVSVDALSPTPHPPWIDEFFGKPDPPRELVILKVG